MIKIRNKNLFRDYLKQKKDLLNIIVMFSVLFVLFEFILMYRFKYLFFKLNIFSLKLNNNQKIILI